MKLQSEPRKIKGPLLLEKTLSSNPQYVPTTIPPHLKRRKYSVQSFELMEDGRVLQQIQRQPTQDSGPSKTSGPGIYIQQSLKDIRKV